MTFHQFDRAMGIAVKPGAIAICTRKEVWFAREAPDIAAKLEPRGHYDSSFLARTSHFTDDIQAHESAWVGSEFWVVNTLFSCLAALHPVYSFAPRWRPPFVTALRPEDRCHLNGMAVVDGQPRYVTALAETDSPEGWRAVKATGGCLIEVPSGRIVAPRSGLATLAAGGRGSDLLSPLGERRAGRGRSLERPGQHRGEAAGRCARTGPPRRVRFRGSLESQANPRGSAHRGPARRVAMWPVGGGFDVPGPSPPILRSTPEWKKIFDVQVLPGIISPHISGPWAERDTGQPFWTVPPPRE